MYTSTYHKTDLFSGKQNLRFIISIDLFFFDRLIVINSILIKAIFLKSKESVRLLCVHKRESDFINLFGIIMYYHLKT